MMQNSLKGLYPISPSEYLSDTSYIDNCIAVIHSGVSLFQFRSKGFSAKKKRKYISTLYEECVRCNVQFIINDFYFELNKYESAGLHLGFNDGNIKLLREKYGDHRIIGVSCYDSVENAREAERQGASYVSFGSMYNTSNKKDFTICKSEVIIRANRYIQIPICVIGGINLSNIAEQIDLKPNMIAIIDGIFKDKNFPDNLKSFLSLIRNE